MNADWRREANCRGLSPSMFFPDRGEHVDDALAVCAACTVAKECLAYGLTLREAGRPVGGVWGNSTEQQRRKIRRELRRAA